MSLHDEYHTLHVESRCIYPVYQRYTQVNAKHLFAVEIN
ncbi:hypothetical protein VCHA54P499_240033 [Vibrio chagasii]|nr:hypothetical protein VCHA34O109_150101 [Vibrio chagasii]CAH6963755.1 hypothetical protein VCHA36P164_30289 [Vibrio chagasii]CAH7004791.1 hypothetical protein VCHA40P242_10259 [Vibrio chagasii]CAH7146855.1 hypothetical protein VCHA54P499_240033 [Vibrio chagasii]CAH7188981.1 hypothetical protein VCHA53O466_270034 [Vibrio chagasii]